jgi:hypothetical protein
MLPEVYIAYDVSANQSFVVKASRTHTGTLASRAGSIRAGLIGLTVGRAGADDAGRGFKCRCHLVSILGLLTCL